MKIIAQLTLITAISATIAGTLGQAQSPDEPSSTATTTTKDTLALKKRKSIFNEKMSPKEAKKFALNIGYKEIETDKAKPKDACYKITKNKIEPGYVENGIFYGAIDVPVTEAKPTCYRRR